MTAATGIGARVLRTEDKRFLTGTGRYVDDLPLARATYAWGVFGALMVFVAILLLVAWFYDRRQVERYEES